MLFESELHTIAVRLASKLGGLIYMNIFLMLAFLFLTGSIFGWVLEVFYRRFFSGSNPQHKWVNPGFLIGPWLPLYGFSLCVLYLLATCEQYLAIESQVLRKLILFVAMAGCVTLLEYLIGLICIKFYKVRLWDYSRRFGNVQGIICPLFTLFWAILSAVYYLFVHPHILNAIRWLSQNLAFSFFIGLFFGILLVDFVYSARLLANIRKFAADKGIIVKLEELKSHIRERKEQLHEHVFVLPLYSKGASLVEHLNGYLEALRKRTHSDK